MPDQDHPGMSKGVKVAAVLAVILACSSLFMFVLPGYYLYRAGDMFFGHRYGQVHSDKLLPIAMLVQILWAPVMPLALALSRRLYGRAPSASRLAMSVTVALCLAYGWAILLAVMFHSLMAES